MKSIKQSRKTGFTLVDVVVVVAIIGLLAAIAVPNFISARATSQQNYCVNNMVQITCAVNAWANDTKRHTGASVVFFDLTSYIQLDSNGSIPPCPGGGTYTLGAVGNLPQVTCSLSTLTSCPHMSP